jgi:4-cresol dehydrogenase (hydroxylating)
MGIMLMRKPESIEAFAMAVERADQLPALLDALRELELGGAVRSTVHVANDLRVISAQRSYPWDLTGGKTPLPEEVRLKLRREGGIGAWNVMGGLYGYREIVAATKKVLRRKLSYIGRVHFFNRKKIDLAKRFVRYANRAGVATRIENRLASAASVYDLLCGIPTPDHLRGTGWRVKTDLRQADDAIRDVGLAWISPVVPLDGEQCKNVADDLAKAFSSHGFDSLFTISTVAERAAVCVASISSQNPQASQVSACYSDCVNLLKSYKTFVYRKPVFSFS